LPGSADDATAAAAAVPGGSQPAPDAAAVVTGRARAAGAVGGWLRQQRQARGWNVPQTARRLRAAAAAIGDTLPGRATLEAHIRRWERGVIAPSERYKLLYCHALGISTGRYGQAPTPPPPLTTLADHTCQPSGPAGPVLPPDQDPGAAVPGPCCPALLARQIADAITAGVACGCGHGHAAPSYPGAAPEQADPDEAIRRLITEAAYQRGAEVTAIARVTGLTTAEVRSVLRTAYRAAWTS
jgi:transcriptional regulator with XRE-family HTH domain